MLAALRDKPLSYWSWSIGRSGGSGFRLPNLRSRVGVGKFKPPNADAEFLGVMGGTEYITMRSKQYHIAIHSIFR
jgi:microcystin-dependent protein